MDNEQWARTVSSLDYAFQPIVSIHTGLCLGYEALLRNWNNGGFSGIQEVFDGAYEDGMLFQVELWLREKAIKKFTAIKGHHNMKLFFNIDNRVLIMPDYAPGHTSRLLHRYGLLPESLCFEISERHELDYLGNCDNILSIYRQQAYKIAIDDFGAGYSGLRLLYHSEPDFIKIDRFFIAGIETDSKKKLFVGKVLNLAHILGIIVIAEGVETEKEYYICKEIGCDYIQGYLVQRPTLDVAELNEKYECIGGLSIRDRRERTLDHALLHEQMEYLEPISLHSSSNEYFTDMPTVFEKFRKSRNRSFFPVTNGHGEPLGLIRESELKEYAYSRYGKDLLLNRAAGKRIMDFIVKCPVTEINTRIEKILEYFAVDETSEGILLTENGKYLGFLSARSLLKVINDKNIAIARDQNPLTKLPGNTLIAEFLEKVLEDLDTPCVIVYFDFNFFKAFNDHYGFRRGDRAILLFADILKEATNNGRFFMGHVGGDDFFAAFKATDIDVFAIHTRIVAIVNKFSHDVASLYDPADRDRGCIETTDREGNEKRFPLLSVSAAVLNIPARQRLITLEGIGTLIAELKKEAKRSDNKIAISTLPTENTGPPLIFVSDGNGAAGDDPDRLISVDRAS